MALSPRGGENQVAGQRGIFILEYYKQVEGF
jgi:hypothetical protein